MIRYGETILNFPDETLCRWSDKYLCLDDLRLFGVLPTEQHAHRCPNCLYFNYSEPTSYRFTQLYHPTGAARWTFGLFVVTRNRLDEFADAQTEWLTYHCNELWRTSNDPAFRFPMTPLPARPWQRDPSTGTFKGVWMVPLVDDRYFWQYITTGEISTEDLTKPRELLQYLVDRTDADIAIPGDDDFDENYLMPDYSQWDHQNIAVVMDSVAHEFGLRLVPVLQEDDDGTQPLYEFMPWSRAMTVDAQNRDGEPSVAQNSGNPPTFAQVQASSPVRTTGDSFEDYFQTSLLPNLLTILFPDGHTYDVRLGGIAKKDRTIFSTVNEGSAAEKDEHAILLTENFDDGLMRRHDICFGGTQAWQLTSYDDFALFTQQMHPEVLGQTRIQSLPYNFAANPVAEGGGNGIWADFEALEIPFCDKDGRRWVRAKPWVDGQIVPPCVALPGYDQYEQAFLLDLATCISPNDAEVPGARILASWGSRISDDGYGNTVCGENFWSVRAICGVADCSQYLPAG